jgi:hypothetical protein
MTIDFPRADPAALADFDPASKVCQMNCGPSLKDPRSAIERRFLCPDCWVIQPKETPAGYAYSFDGERYHGEFPTRGDAIAAALDSDDATAFRTAKIKPAIDYLIPEIIGNRIVEQIDESLIDDITYEEAIVTLSHEDEILLGKLVLGFMRRRADWRAWGVTAVCDHTRHNVTTNREPRT